MLQIRGASRSAAFARDVATVLVFVAAGFSAMASANAAPGDREVDELTAFQSPSGNVGCQLSPTGVRCDIDQRDWSPPPRPADCRLDYGQGISLGAGKQAHLVCAGDTARTGSAEPLAYGAAITAGPIRCESTEAGMTCRDTGSGHGFSISREAYRLF
ncbi:DUF6636 domain-containing protein [Mycolicibacterium sp. HK-90]|uniref:DUF6636 domain-containing protein n=1 Tax=Mycolicibacterium sp. HK-90 TaxID=3056937 RepID=UPI00265885E4|nr:DUF6636 domain-containing protein [Mycolicibacterium sp. HK-90]WKG03507.1 hypothetical protein QU592_30815 [Mycolicibacterium sp. HK-90]